MRKQRNDSWVGFIGTRDTPSHLLVARDIIKSSTPILPETEGGGASDNSADFHSGERIEKISRSSRSAKILLGYL